MNDPCPTCGLVFQREPGYFLGAMYVSYGLASALLCGGYYLGAALLPDWDRHYLVALLVLIYLPFVPLVFRYSRAIWIYFDRWGQSSDLLAGSYERARGRKSAGHEANNQANGRPANH